MQPAVSLIASSAAPLPQMVACTSWLRAPSSYSERASTTCQAGQLCEMDSDHHRYRKHMTLLIGHQAGNSLRLQLLKIARGRKYCFPCADRLGRCCGHSLVLERQLRWTLPRHRELVRLRLNAYKHGFGVGYVGLCLLQIRLAHADLRWMLMAITTVPA